jgi:hypothetical protein
MYVAQETTDIDGIEHKPLKMTGESDKVEVMEKNFCEKKLISLFI